MPIEPGTVNAPEFPADLDWVNTDAPLRMADLRGKIVLLDFWTYCCINCMHVLPDLKRLEQKYRDELVVIGVHSAKFEGEKDTENIRQAVMRYGIEHPVVNDHSMAVWQEYACRAWPTMMLIDPRGKIIGTHSGEGIFELFDRVIGQMIEHFRGDGTLDTQRLTWPLELANQPAQTLAYPGKVLAAGERLFVADSNHNRILVIDRASGRVQDVIGSGLSGLDDGAFADATFQNPQGMALHNDWLFVADTANHAIRRADLGSRQVVTLAGTGTQSLDFECEPGPAKGRELNSPWDLEIAHGVLFIAMAGPHQIWGMDLDGEFMAGHAGSGREDHVDGPLLAAALAQPSGLSSNGEVLFIADSEVSSVRTADLDPRGGHVRTILGQGLFDFGDVDGPNESVRLQHPLGIVHVDGMLYVADTYNNKIKRIDLENGATETFAGSGAEGSTDGPGPEASFDEPGGLSHADGKLYVADTNNHRVRIVDLKTRAVTSLTVEGEVDSDAAYCAVTVQ